MREKLLNFIGYLPIALIMIGLLTDLGPQEAFIADFGLWFFGFILFTGIFFLGYFSKKIGEWLGK